MCVPPVGCVVLCVSSSVLDVYGAAEAKRGNC